MAMREVPHEKNMDLKSMQVHVTKSVTKMTKRGGGNMVWLQWMDEGLYKSIWICSGF